MLTAAALVSLYGWLAGNILNVPRLTMAMADRGDLPAIFGRVHPVFRTPWFSIVIYAALAWLLGLTATLLQNVSLSAVSRLITYGLLCLALPGLRAKATAPPALFRAPAGRVLAAAGVAACLILLLGMTRREGWTLLATSAAATVHWLILRKP